MHNRNALITAVILIGALLLGGCVKQKQVAAVSPTPWRTLASGAYMVDKDRMFYGIGKASGLRSATLLRATADNQAQAEMARIVGSYLGELSHAAGYPLTQDQDQETINALNATILRHARISEHRYDESSGVLYALCSLELSTLRQVISQMAYLDDNYRKNLLVHVEPVFTQFSGNQIVRSVKSPLSRSFIPQTIREVAVVSRAGISAVRRSLDRLFHLGFANNPKAKSS